MLHRAPYRPQECPHEAILRVLGGVFLALYFSGLEVQVYHKYNSTFIQ